MKKIFTVVFALVLFAYCANAQDKAASKEFNFSKNNVKINLYGLALRSFSLQYERGLTRKISVSLGVRLQPKGSLPFHSAIENAISNSNNSDTAQVNDAGKDFAKNAQMGSWAVTPEFRYYFGKKPLNGFYVAPYVRIDGYNISWNYHFQKSDGTFQDIGLSGNTGSVSVGLLLGAQWHIGKHFLIDWWIIGPQYGSYNLTLNGNSDLSSVSATDKQTLQDDIDGIGFNGSKFKSTVTNSGVKATTKMNLPGLRTGLCLGYTF